jgi:hypothetical protein
MRLCRVTDRALAGEEDVEPQLGPVSDVAPEIESPAGAVEV